MSSIETTAKSEASGYATPMHLETPSRLVGQITRWSQVARLHERAASASLF